MQRITKCLCEIVAGRKTVEYRALKPYWTNMLTSVSTPFNLRLVNGMSATAQKIAVVRKAWRTSRARQYELHLGEVLDVRHWDGIQERPLA
jgi:hypothetical protein